MTIVRYQQTKTSTFEEVKMSEKEIIDLWKQGYSVEQITNKSMTVKKGKDKKATYEIMHRIEKIIFKYQTTN